ncbi:MAG: ABC transporter permease subunit [Treponema sp.]|nr:ABC transporter permease subunit [Treponema sp.]
MTATSEAFVKRYLIHLFMIFLALIAVVPIYVLLINATRTTEEINMGLAILPSSRALRSTTDVIVTDWNSVVIGGRVQYLDLIPGDTLREEVNKKTGITEKRVRKTLTESRQPRIVIVDNNDEVLATYNLSNNAQVFVENGQRVEKGITIARVVTPSNIVYNWTALTGRGFQIWQGFGNSAFISISATLLSVYFSAMTAYGLHVYRFKGRRIIWSLILIIMMLPGTITFIGFYKLMALMKLTNSFLPLILPGIAAAATVLFIRQYMMSVLSLELIDSARIDGANEYAIFNIIILPVVIPALAAQAIFTFVNSWNNFITPQILLSDKKLATLPMLIYALQGDIYRTETGGIYLGIAVSLIPILIFYAFMSQFIISGITMGSIKE